MIGTQEIIETVNMSRANHLDVRTITMGISLLDCISDGKTAVKVYDKVASYAENLVAVGEKIAEIGRAHV